MVLDCAWRCPISRVATISCAFIGDISDAESKLDALMARARGGIPVNFNGGGGSASGTSTLGGQSVSSSAPFPTGAASPNLSFLGSQIAQQISAALAPALQAVTASIPTSSPNLSGMMQSSMTAALYPTGAASPNWGMYFGQMQQQMQAMMPTSSPNWSYLLGNRGGPPRTPGMGGMRALFAGGMLLHSGLAAADAARQDNIDSALLGRNDFAGQYEASMDYRKRLTGSIPFIGGMYDLMEDPSGSEEAGGRLALQSSRDTDAATASMRSSFMARGRLSGEYTAMASPAGYLRNKVEIENRFGPLSSMGQKDLRDREVAPLTKTHEDNRSELQRKFGPQISGTYATAGAGPGVGASMGGQADDLQRQMDDALRAEDAAYNALVAQVDQRYANIDKLRDAARKAADAANERQRTADVGSLRRTISGGFTGPRGSLVDRMTHGQDMTDPGDPELNKLVRDADAAELRRFDLVSGNHFRVTTATNMMRARGDTFGAKMMAVGGVAFSDWAEADQTQGGPALAAGLSGMYATFMEGTRSTSLVASSYAGHAAANSLALARNPLDAQLRRQRTDREAALFPLGDRTDPSAVLLRSNINSSFDSDASLTRQGFKDAVNRADLHLGGERDQLRAMLRHDPFGASLDGIVTTGLDRATEFGIHGMRDQQVSALQNTMLQLKLTEQQMRESFHATEIGQNFDTSSPRGQASLAQMMKDLVEAATKIETAIKAATSAK